MLPLLLLLLIGKKPGEQEEVIHPKSPGLGAAHRRCQVVGGGGVACKEELYVNGADLPDNKVRGGS